MRILAVSHSCVTEVNQELFVELAGQPDAALQLLMPAGWVSEYTGKRFTPSLLPTVRFSVTTLPVWMPGHISLHCYRRLPISTFRQFRPDVMLSSQEPWSLSGFQAVMLARRLKIPFVFQTNQNLYKTYPPPFGWIERLHFRTAAHALAYSEEARQVMLRKGISCPSSVSPYGIDLSLFHPADSKPLRTKLGLGDAVVIGYMGRLVPEKGLDDLLEALAALKQQEGIPAWKLLLVGSGSSEEELRRGISRLGLDGDVVFTGAVPHLEAGSYMRCIDIFALPSRTMPFWKEQFGRVIVEAMACGTPVIGSDSGEIPHLIRGTGGGIVFREGDVKELTGALRRLLVDPAERRALGETGRQKVGERYTFAAVARQLYEVLGEAIRSHKAERRS